MKKILILSVLCSLSFIGSSYAQTISTSGSLSVYSPPDGDQLEEIEFFSIAPVSGLYISLEAVASSTYGSHANAKASTGWGTFEAVASYSNQYSTKEITLNVSGQGHVWLSVFAHEDAWAAASFLTY